MSAKQRYDLLVVHNLIPSVMGESKRRKESLGEKYGKDPYIYPWLPITKEQGQQFVKWSNRGARIGIGFLVISWVTVRFIGPAFGWWQVN